MESSKKVLLVEDDNGVRAAVTSILSRHGYSVLGVPDGDSAMKAVDQADLVLLDIFIPKMTGDEFLRRLREKGNYIPVVVMSAAMSESDAKECFSQFKIVDFVSKPFKTKDLLEKVDRAASIAEDFEVVKSSAARLKSFVNRQVAL